MTIEIEKNIPFQPEPRRRKYPFARMDIGDSFGYESKDVSMATMVYIENKKSKKKFKISRKEKRVWRVS